MKKLIILLSAILIYSCKDEPQFVGSNKKDKTLLIDSLKKSVDSLQSVNLDLMDRLTNMETSKESKNLSVEEEFIISRLKQQPELIKMESVLGGRMYFSEVRVLNKKWITATYEDGHVQGSALLKYEIRKDSSIKFKMLDSIEHY